MSTDAPVVYIFHGEDEFSIAQQIATFQEKLGDPTTASMNTTRLDGRVISIEELRGAAAAMPFLAPRRIVIVTGFLSRLGGKDQREKFLAVLENLPDTTALFLIEPNSLETRRSKKHWLLAWAENAGGRAYVRGFSLQRPGEMARWIQRQARDLNGQFSAAGAAMLASLVGSDTRMAYQEIQKLLAYVNYKRGVEPDDVELVASSFNQGNIFALVDALGEQDGRKAQYMLRQMLEVQDALSIYGMVIRQFRLLLLGREALDEGLSEAAYAKAAGVPPFVASKMYAQARRFDITTLEAVYRRLLEIDEAIKTGQVEPEVALDTFVVAFTSRPLPISR
jgi:DNA polymerase-3 subunit delta